MTRTMTKNQALNTTFNRYYPGGHTNFRGAKDLTRDRLFQARAAGSRFWDMDGNEYIDYMAGMGPNILGHRHPEYTEALQSYIESLSVCSGSCLLFSEDDITVAERLMAHIPCAERVKFHITGSEAVQMAIRLARAYTGRPYVLRFGGHYHGWFDNVLGGVPDPDPEGKPFPLAETSGPFMTEGKSPEASSGSFMLPWNDLPRLEKTLQDYGDQIAMIQLEAIVCNNKVQYPRPGFLERIRELCNQYGIVMSFDEIITGFRLGLSGAQGALGVTPDICTLGKALGGGLPISAVVGKAEIMDTMLDGIVLGPGTFNGYPLAMRAVKTTLDILARNNGAAYQEMARVQQGLTTGLAEIARRRGIAMRVQQATGVFLTLWGVDPNQEQYTDADAADYDGVLAKQFCKAMMEQGVAIIGDRWYPSIVHTDDDTARVLDVADRVLATLSR